MALKSSNPKGNEIFHLALNPDGTLQPIMSAQLRIEDEELILELLDTSWVRMDSFMHGSGTYYYVAYDGYHERPVPSAMLWKYREEGDDAIILDVDMSDLTNMMNFIVENYLK